MRTSSGKQLRSSSSVVRRFSEVSESFSRKHSKTRKNTKKHNGNELLQIYTENDYNSNDGMLTSVWGPSMWHYLHTMSFNYPVNPTQQDKQHYYDFIQSLKWVLPCGKCRKNLRKNFKKIPLTMSLMKSRDTFSKYIYDLHELINHMLGKKSALTYDMVRERYEHFRARCVKDLNAIKIKTTLLNKTMKKQYKMNEKGCIEPLYGKKTKCVLKIVPQNEKCESFQTSPMTKGHLRS